MFITRISVLLFIIFINYIPFANANKSDNLFCIKENNGYYNIFNFRFVSKIQGLTFQDNNLSGCYYPNKDDKNSIIAKLTFRDDDNVQSGETIVANWTIILNDDYINDNLEELIKQDIDSRIEDITKQYQKDKRRYIDFIIIADKTITKTRYGLCQGYTIEVKDYKPRNKPKYVDYLLERSVAKICYRVDNRFWAEELLLSQRSTTDRMPSFDYLQTKLNNIEQDILFSADSNYKYDSFNVKSLAWVHQKLD